MDSSLTNITIKKMTLDTYLETWIDAFLLDRKVQNLSRHTLEFYHQGLKLFMKFCGGQVITDIAQITPVVIREYLYWLETTGHSPGGQHAAYRTLKVFMRWLWDELELETRNPIEKVKAPRVALDPLEPVSLDDVMRLVKVCGDNLLGLRDKALFLFLLDTGARASEALNVDLDDVDMVSGAVVIRRGKGGKTRTTFLGQKARKAVRKYISTRRDEHPALFVTMHGETTRLNYSGLLALVGRRAAQAGIEPPEIHSFRRAYAINMLRAGVDVYSLQSLMGHSDLQVLRRYLKQTDSDLAAAHRKGSPVDNLNFEKRRQ